MKHISVGIIGLGSFGNLAASIVAANSSARVLGYDRAGRTSEYVQSVGLSEVAQCEVIILAVPLMSYPDILEKLQPVLRAESLLIDVCSVKVYPEQFIKEHLPSHRNILLTHPLFGPQSAQPLAGRQLIVTRCAGDLAEKALAFCEQQLGLAVTRVTSEEHDRVMAQAHALTFFIAEGLAKMKLSDAAFSTPSYSLLTNLVDFRKTHSNELFDTVQHGNPFARDIRQRLIHQLQQDDYALEKPLFQENL